MEKLDKQTNEWTSGVSHTQKQRKKGRNPVFPPEDLIRKHGATRDRGEKKLHPRRSQLAARNTGRALDQSEPFKHDPVRVRAAMCY